MISSRQKIALLAAAASVALVPGAPAFAQAVVQATPNPAEQDLTNALQRLSGNPRNVPALLDAGYASLALDDERAAVGFFNRAQAERPDDGRVLIGLALVAVRRGEGPIAIQLFDNANAAGSPMAPFASDRGLAYDLVGANSRAQGLYRQALSREENDEVVRRLALSYAISGDGAASEATLLPLLQRQDRRAYRTRAFALAILGRDDEANSIAETMLPPRLSQRLSPYLQYMPRLTRAQQAAAANLGRFPVIAEIGRDTPQIAALDSQPSRPAPPQSDRLTPAGQPLGPAQPVQQSIPQPQPQAQPAPAPRPAPAPTPTPAQPAREATGELPALASAQPAQSYQLPASQVPPPPARAPSPVVAATMEAEAAADAPRPSFSITVPEPEPEPAREQLDLSEAFADFSLPPGGMSVPSNPDAVDITTIQPAREAPPEPAAPPPPAHPSRHWVQVATGQDTSAFRFDWRRLQRSADGLLDGREAYTAPWNQTNRLLTGPFESQSAAQAFVTQLGEAGVDAFRFTSAEGEEITAID